MTISYGNTEDIIRAFEEFVKKEDIKVNEEMLKTSKEALVESLRHREFISNFNQERRQKNRDCWKFLQGKVLNFGTGYLVTPRNIDTPEEV